MLEKERGRVGVGEMSVDISQLPAALYLVKLKTEDAVGVQKIVII